MKVSDKLTSQQFQEIAMNIFNIGQNAKDMQPKQLIEVIKEQILSAIRNSSVG